MMLADEKSSFLSGDFHPDRCISLQRRVFPVREFRGEMRAFRNRIRASRYYLTVDKKLIIVRDIHPEEWSRCE